MGGTTGVNVGFVREHWTNYTGCVYHSSSAIKRNKSFERNYLTQCKSIWQVCLVTNQSLNINEALSWHQVFPKKKTLRWVRMFKHQSHCTELTAQILGWFVAAEHLFARVPPNLRLVIGMHCTNVTDWLYIGIAHEYYNTNTTSIQHIRLLSNRRIFRRHQAH